MSTLTCHVCHSEAIVDRHGGCALSRVRVGLVFISLYVTEFKPLPGPERPQRTQL